MPLQDFSAWIGRSETRRDTLGPTPLAALAATLDHDAPAAVVGTPLPPLWHWLYFLPLHRHSELGPDGHARRGGFLPPVPLPRRMWAGSRFEFRSPLRVGDAVERRSTIDDVSARQGRSGPLIFVTVRHHVHCNGSTEPALVEFHDIVYRGASQADGRQPTPQPAPQGAPWLIGCVARPCATPPPCHACLPIRSARCCAPPPSEAPLAERFDQVHQLLQALGPEELLLHALAGVLAPALQPGSLA